MVRFFIYTRLVCCTQEWNRTDRHESAKIQFFLRNVVTWIWWCTHPIVVVNHTWCCSELIISKQGEPTHELIFSKWGQPANHLLACLCFHPAHICWVWNNILLWFDLCHHHWTIDHLLSSSSWNKKSTVSKKTSHDVFAAIRSKMKMYTEKKIEKKKRKISMVNKSNHGSNKQKRQPSCGSSLGHRWCAYQTMIWRRGGGMALSANFCPLN